MNTWLREHPCLNLPGLAKATITPPKASTFERYFFAHDGETIWIDHLRVNQTMKGQIMMKPDGSCTLLKHESGSNQSRLKCQIWLGGESGFSNTIFAYKDGATLQNGKAKASDEASWMGDNKREESDSDGKLFRSPDPLLSFVASHGHWQATMPLF